MNVIDLFAGCGGLSLGFIQAGHNVNTAVEFDSMIARTYALNHPTTNVIVEDMINIGKTNFFKEGSAEVIIGGPPCQGFSMAGARIRAGFVDDQRNYLFEQYFNIIKKVKPKAFVMENVKGILTIRNGKIFQNIMRLFSESEIFNGYTYSVHCRTVKAVDFGIPQKRERIVIIGFRNKNINLDDVWNLTKSKIIEQYPDYFNLVTVRDAIGNLPKVSFDGEIKNPKPITNYQRYLSSDIPFIKNHNQTKHSDIAVNRMSRVSNGENFTALGEKINSIHSGSYGRLCWDEQAPTITTRFDTPAGGRFIHPVEDRTLSPREAARIQSFPDDFIFYGNKTSICKQIGNAVPPKIAYFLARLVENILKSEA